MKDLVVVSLEPWDEVWRRNQHLVAGLMRATPDLRVLFVEPAVDPLHAARLGHLSKAGRGLRPGADPAGPDHPDGDRLWLLEPTKTLPRRIDPGQDKRWAVGVARAARRVGMVDPVLWVNDPVGAELLTLTSWPLLYDLTDDWLAADRPPTEHARLVRQEGRLLETAAVVVACSPSLVATKGRDRPVVLVTNGVDTAAYDEVGGRPADLPEGPVALYVGTVHTDRIDLDLCVATALALGEDASLVLLGPAPLRPTDAHRLTDAGVRLLGARPGGEVPAYLAHADVLVVPHLRTEFTESLDPIKRYEYEAAGRPVVSTPVAGFREWPAAVVVTSAEFPSAVAQVLAQHRPRTPLTHTRRAALDWSGRVAQMAETLDETGAGGPRLQP